MDKTVYFLGAGASAGSDYNLPMMRGFFREEDFGGSQYCALLGFIQKYFPNVSFQELNLEELITQLELSLEGFGSLWGIPPPEYSEFFIARQEFNDYILMRLSHYSTEIWRLSSISPEAVCTIHKKLFSIIGDLDTIVSLNYDLITDVALYEVSPKNDKGEPTKNSILGRSLSLIGKSLTWGGEVPSIHYEDIGFGYYLKLHGSLHWLYCPNPNCSNHEQFFVAHEHRPGHPCILCGAALVSVIIPPALGKSFEKFPKMGFLWHLAYREIGECAKVVFIGMSLPESDYYLRWLLREAVRRSVSVPDIVVVNPDDVARNKTCEVLGIPQDNCDYFDSLKDYVEQLD